MTVSEFLASNPSRAEVEGALWAERHLTPVLSALDRIKLAKALEAAK